MCPDHRITSIAVFTGASPGLVDGNSLLGHETTSVAIRFPEDLWSDGAD